MLACSGDAFRGAGRGSLAVAGASLPVLQGTVIVLRPTFGTTAREQAERTLCSARGVGMEDFEDHGRYRLPSVILEADPTRP